MQRVHYKRLAIQLGGASEKDMAAKYRNRSDFSLGERTMDSFSKSFGIPLGQRLSIVIDRLLLEEIDLRTKLEIYLQIERKDDELTSK